MFKQILNWLGFGNSTPLPSNSVNASNAINETIVYGKPPPIDEANTINETIVYVMLGRDRLSDGSLTVEQDGVRVLGPIAIICAIDRDFAARSGNPDGDPLKPFGEIPTGRYRLLGKAQPDDVPLPIDEDTGTNPILVFRAIDGQAALAEANGRGDLLLHGGRQEPGLGTLKIPDERLARLSECLVGKVTLCVDEQVVPVTRSRRPERISSPVGRFPGNNSHASSRYGGALYDTAATYQDPMDGFLSSYLIGWPTNITPGAFLGAMMHDRDDSGSNLQNLGVPVIQDDQPQSQPQIDQSSNDPSVVPDVPDANMPFFDAPASVPDYTPSGGAYDR